MYILKKIIKSVVNCTRNVFLIVFGNKIKIGSGVYLDLNTNLKGNNLINDYSRLISVNLDKYSYVSPFCILIDCNIGRFCSIGPGVKAGLGVHPIDGVSTSPYIYNEQLFKTRREEDFSSVEIGHDVWIGANALIMGGVKIGIGAVIGAGAVVTRDVPNYAVVVGCPARIIKKRFSDEKIDRLINSKWWEMDIQSIRRMESE